MCRPKFNHLDLLDSYAYTVELQMAQTLVAHSPWLVRTNIMIPAGQFKHNPPWIPLTRTIFHGPKPV